MIDQILINKQYAKSKQIDRHLVTNPALRIYRDSPYTITLQVRTHTDKTARISYATVTRAEALEIAAFLTRKAEELSDEAPAKRFLPTFSGTPEPF